MMIFSRFGLLIGLLECFLIATSIRKDSVTIVTPEARVAIANNASSPPATTPIPAATLSKGTKSAQQRHPPTEKLLFGNKTFEWPSNDSYVLAYVGLHRKSAAKRNDQYGLPETSYNTVIRSSVIPEHRYPSLTQDWASTANSHSDVSSVPVVPGAPGYGVSHPYRHYDHSQATSHWHGKPYSSPSFSFFGLLPKKLSIKLIFKIILKLILFKMIVKFIAVICLLLFFPALKSRESHGGMNENQDDDGDDDMRKLQHVNDMSEIIWKSIIKNENLYGQKYKVIDNQINGNYDDDEGDDEELKEKEKELIYIKKIADLADEDPPASGAYRAVVFLRYCVQAVERIAGLMIRHLREPSHNNHWSSNLFKRMITFGE